MKRLLIANRGEIACRIIRSARQLGLETVAIYSQADRMALHVELADQAVCIGPAPAQQSYLNQQAVLQAVRDTGADALHPGYGFLAENPEFARACEQAGITFVGPAAEVIVQMGEKHAARQVALAAGVPVLPGTEQASDDLQQLKKQAEALGFPLMLKPVAGGGGKGMRKVEQADELESALQAAMREARSAFGDGRLLLERYLHHPRHVEMQVLADQQGHAIHLFERDCSLQRRHQKIIEESPAPGLTNEQRQQLGEAALKLVRATGYTGAGTVEFLLDDQGWYFMEMNTRLQVEHPVTEAVTGVDLVAWQLRIAAGEALNLKQEDLRLNGHAVELRLCAEDPERGFLPQTGRIKTLNWPQMPGLRIDSGFRQGDAVSPHYDSLLAKLIVHGHSRDAALTLAQQALQAVQLQGLKTNRLALLQLLQQPPMRKGKVDVQWLDQHPDAVQIPAPPLDEALAVLALRQLPDPQCQPLSLNGPPRYLFFWQVQEQTHQVLLQFDVQGWQASVDGQSPLSLHALDAQRVEIRGHSRVWQTWQDGDDWLLNCGAQQLRVQACSSQDTESAAQEHALHAPMPGQVLECLVAEGDTVQAGDVLLVLEAMKMEHQLQAGKDGKVSKLAVAAGDRVQEGQLLLELE